MLASSGLLSTVESMDASITGASLGGMIRRWHSPSVAIDTSTMRITNIMSTG
jgi:hypothetical protein